MVAPLQLMLPFAEFLELAPMQRFLWVVVEFQKFVHICLELP